MELLALDKTIKKPPRSDEGDGELFCGTPTVAADSSVVLGAGSNIIQNCKIGETYLVTSGFVGADATQYIVSGGEMLFSHTTKIGSNTNGFAIVFIATATNVTLAYSRDYYSYSIAHIE